MSIVSKTARMAVLGVVLMLMHAPDTWADLILIRDYQLNDTFSDSLGNGPDLVANGGMLDASGYAFGPNQGLTLSNPGVTDTYRIVVSFYLDSLESWRKIIDYANLTSDDGFYNINTALQLWPYPEGPADALTPGVMAELALTRDGATNLFTASVNGENFLSTLDATGAGIVSAANVLKFFIDDPLTDGVEASAGFVSRIQIFGPDATAVPAPGSLFVTAIASVAVLLSAAYRRRRGV